MARAQQWQQGAAECRQLKALAQHGTLTPAQFQQLHALAATYGRQPTPMPGHAPTALDSQAALPAHTTFPDQPTASGEGVTALIPPQTGTRMHTAYPAAQPRSSGTTSTPLDPSAGTSHPHVTPITHQPSAADAALQARHTLETEEANGGHTIEKHVGLADSQLRRNLKKSPNQRYQSTFGSEPAANRAIGLATKQTSKIESWLADPRSNDIIALDVDARSTIGRVLERGQDSSEPTSKARILLKKDSTCERGYFVLSAFPVK